MSGIFVNYRQNRQVRLNDGGLDLELCDHAQLVEAVADRLVRHFGQDVVFLDTEIRLASRYPDELRGRLLHSDVVVAIVHEGWLDDLRQGLDWVQDELRRAIDAGIPVLPVRLDGVRPLKRDHLPEPIRELAMFQSHQIRFGHWKQDMQRLIKAIEPHVAVEPVQRMDVPSPPKAHGWAPLIVAGLIGVAAPYVATMFLVGPLPERTVWLMALAGALLAGLVGVYGTAGIVYLARRYLDDLNAASAKQPHDEKTNVIIGLTVAGISVMVLLTGDLLPVEIRVVAVGVIALLVVTLGSQWIRYRENVTRWPQPRLVADPASIRAALARVAKHLDTCQVPLSRLEHDQAGFALDQITVSLAQLGELAAMNRRSWLRVSALWRTCSHAVWFGATVGAAGGALVTYWQGGGKTWQAPGLAALWFALAAACYLATINRTYALQQWRRRVVVESAPEAVNSLTKRFLDMSVPRSKENPSS